MKKSLIILVLAALAIVPALAVGGYSKLTERARAARAERKAKLEAMTPEERAEFKRKATERRAMNRKAERERRTKEMTAKYRAAKEACGKDCYRVIITNGVVVAMTKPQYEAYEAEAASNKVIRARGIKVPRRRNVQGVPRRRSVQGVRR